MAGRTKGPSACCEAEQSISLALFPELCDMAHAENTDIKGFLPAGHVTGVGILRLSHTRPLPGRERWHRMCDGS